MRCLILSDIHSNLAALEAVLQAAPTHDQVWCLGDVVGYGPEPARCTERVLAAALLCIAGNHDWGVTGKLDLGDFNPEARAANLWNRQHLDQSHLEALTGLPTVTTVEGFTLVHGSPRHPIWEYVTRPSIALPNFSFFDTPVCLVGHTHVPAVYRLVEENGSRWCEASRPAAGESMTLGDQRMILNPGSVGQPRDRNPDAAYALLDTSAGTVQFFRQPYMVSETQRKMAEAGLPRRLISRLAAGW